MKWRMALGVATNPVAMKLRTGESAGSPLNGRIFSFLLVRGPFCQLQKNAIGNQHHPLSTRQILLGVATIGHKKEVAIHGSGEHHLPKTADFGGILGAADDHVVPGLATDGAREPTARGRPHGDDVRGDIERGQRLPGDAQEAFSLYSGRMGGASGSTW